MGWRDSRETLMGRAMQKLAGHSCGMPSSNHHTSVGMQNRNKLDQSHSDLYESSIVPYLDPVQVKPCGKPQWPFGDVVWGEDVDSGLT